MLYDICYKETKYIDSKIPRTYLFQARPYQYTYYSFFLKKWTRLHPTKTVIF